MKKLKYILFATIISFASICFTSNVMADSVPNYGVCKYSVEYPFYDGTSVQGNDAVSFTYYEYMKYFLKKVVYKNLDDGSAEEKFYSYINKMVEEIGEYAQTDFVGVANEEFYKIVLEIPYGVESELIVNIRMQFWERYIDSDKEYSEVFNDYVFQISGEDIKKLGFQSSGDNTENSVKCPDLVGVIPSKLSSNFVDAITFVYLDDNDEEELGGDITEKMKNLWNEDVLILTSDNNLTFKLRTGGEMYIAKAYNIYFDDTLDDYNVDPIVEYYLGLGSEFKTILENIIVAHDSNSMNPLSNMEISKLSSIIDFDRIENDLKILKNFNNVYATAGGLRGKLKAFLKASSSASMKVATFFDKYTKKGTAEYNTQYVDVLIELLEFAKSNQSPITAQNDVEEVITDIKDCEENDTECIKEACIEIEKTRYHDLICGKENGSTAIYECQKHYSSGDELKKIENKCKDKTKEEVIQEAEKVAEELEDFVNEKFAGYYTEIFKNLGYDIEISDFCDILTSGNIYDYIKLVLNLIRIGGPILVIGLTAFDGMKMISSFKEDENKKFWNHLKIRLICLVILILVPTIINFVVDLFIEGSCDINV